jgi:hypothetical protein
VLKPGTPSPDTFDYKPRYPQADFAGAGSLVSGVSPYGASLATLELNLKHAIEKRDESRTAACLTELFRHFVLLNSPLEATSHASQTTLLGRFTSLYLAFSFLRVKTRKT